MKRIVSLALIVCIVLSFTGCSNPKNAKWDGYDKTSFTVLLSIGLKEMYADKLNTFFVNAEVTHEKGWATEHTPDDFIDSNDISKGAKPYTYTADMYIPYTIIPEEITIKFFMELKGKLSVKGAQISRNGVVQNLSASEARDYLHDLEKYVETELNK